jgi:uncharacterized protein YbaP (TraB family)
LRALAVLVVHLLVFAPAGRARAEPQAPSTAARRAPKPLLWRIERQPPAYLYGTIHIPDPRVLAFPPAVQHALEGSQIVYTEIPLDPATQSRALRAMVLPDGQTLETVLPAELYERAKRFLSGRGVAMALFENQKVWVLATVLPMLHYLGMGEPLDQKLFEWAQSHGKRAEGIETVEMQVAAMESAGREGELALLRDTLAYVESAAESQSDPMDELIDLYLAGDVERVAEVAFGYVDRSDAALRRVLEALIDRRNDYMTQTIAARLRSAPAAAQFFAVGAMHYAGARGILAQLRARGVRITRVTE